MGRAFIDSGRGDAVNWYGTVGFETKGGHVGGQNISVGAVHSISNINLLTLLTSINQHAQAGETIVTVHHGNPQGFAFPLVAGTGVHGTVQALRDLMSDLPADRLQIPNVSSQQVGELRAQMTAIRSKRLGGVEIRACNMGDTRLLEVLRDFFGARYVAAPIVTDFFATIRGVNPTPPARLQTLSSQANYRCFAPPAAAGTSAATDLCVNFQPLGGSAYRIGVHTVQAPGPRTRWMRSYFAAGNVFQPPQGWATGGFVVHGVVLLGVLRFPAETDYRNNIQIYPGTV